MKCLSLWNPWAFLVVTGRKRVETRGWPLHYRGPLLIHSAKKWDTELASLCLTEPFRSTLQRDGIEFDGPGPGFRAGWNLPFGAILGQVDVIDCVPAYSIAAVADPELLPVFSESRRDGVVARRLFVNPTEYQFGDYSAGRYGFLLANPVRFPTPIPYIGRQGVFDVPDSVVAPQLPPPSAEDWR